MGNLHLIIGEDEFLVCEAAKRIIADHQGLETIDSLNSTNEELQLRDIELAKESFLTPPFFDPEKVTWWKNVRFLPGASKGKKDEGESKGPSVAVKAALEDFAKTLVSVKLDEKQHFILSASSLLMTSVFAKTLSEAAEFIVFEKPAARQGPQQAAVRAIDRAKELGLEFAPGAADAFVAIVGEDTRSIYNELDKLHEFKRGSGKVVSQDEVGAITSPGAGVAPVVWHVSDAITRRDVAQAVAKIHEFEGDSGFAVMMTTVIERCFRQLVEAKSAQDSGNWEEFSKSMNPWAARNMAANLGRWSLFELRAARKRFMDLRERVVTSSSLDGSIITIEVIRALGPAKGNRGVKR